MNDIESDNELMKRLVELGTRAFHSGRYTYSSFLSESELSVVYERSRELTSFVWVADGGHETATRQMLRFGDEAEMGYTEEWPIKCVRISPPQKQFSEELTHRDILGAIMNLGIERKALGDIVVGEESYTWIQEPLADFLCEELRQVKHSPVKCQVCETPSEIFQREQKIVTLNVASERIDNVLAVFCKLSRGAAQKLFDEKKVFVNGRQLERYTGVLKCEDRVSVRGYGKFVYLGVEKQTRKERLCVRISVYC